MKARFFRSDALSDEIGHIDDVVIESPSFQITYDLVRTEDDQTIAWYSAYRGGCWIIKKEGDYSEMFSDIVFYTEVE